MAKNREHENIIETDSSDDDDSSKETGSQESDSELELTLKTKRTSSSTPAAAKKPQSASKPQPPFEFGSDSESDPDGPNPKDKSIPTQKPTNGARKSRSKSSAPDWVTPTKSVARKRRAEEREMDAKSKKKAEPDTTEKKPIDDPKKTLNHRVWCEDDEIVILKGLIDYSATKKADPFSDFNDFYDFIKKDLQKKDSNKSQFQDKVRRLKTKYDNNRIKEQSCKEMTFPKPHEQRVYELSKSAWENKNVKEKGVEIVWSPKPKAATKEEPKGVADVDAEIESVLLAKGVKSFGVTVEERILTIGSELFENGKGDAGGKEWNKLRIEEMQVYLRHLEVKSAQARLVIERLKSKGI